MKPTTMIPASAKRVPLRPLALGEKTGHHHSLCATGGLPLEDAAEMYEIEAAGQSKIFLRITAEGVSLQHQEHKSHAVPPGEYEVIIQQEETDWGKRRVRD